MFSHASKSTLILGLFLYTAFLPTNVFAQRPAPTAGPTNRTSIGPSPLEGGDPRIDIDIYVRGVDGSPIDAVVTLTYMTGQVCGQGTTMGGNIKFSGLAATEYTIQAVATGYENAVEEFDGYNPGAARVTIRMTPASAVGNTAPSRSGVVLAPKAQKELNKALEALRANKPAEARSHLDAAYSLAANHPEVNYLFGVYFSQINDQEKAKSSWTKVLEFDPKHHGALISLSEALKRENKLTDAESYAKRAVQADPTSWRAHAIVADVLMQEHHPDDALKEAERALELGQGQAAIVQPLLARILTEVGNKERAMQVLQAYVAAHPDDAAARSQLGRLQTPVASAALTASSNESVIVEPKSSPAIEMPLSLPVLTTWLPPDVDGSVPAVESGATCSLDGVVQKAEKRVQEFVKNVDRFTASELLEHESINKRGFAKSPETRKYNYLVSIEEYRPGALNVMEYRDTGSRPLEFPGGVATLGLPALELIFHPYNAGNFEMSCEGLGRWNKGRAWLVHFRQRTDKPNTIRAYKIGENGPSHPVALRGRAWIAADSYQIVRLETDMVAAMPEIRLLVDHTAIEYGPVRFRDRNVEMWLPQSAEVYSDWKGRRMYRRHSFSNYLLFSVDESQRISTPNVEN